jgi:hypothetical protein
LTGEDLFVIANDSIRQAGVDYDESFGGPKAKIRLIRSLPANTRMRFRTLAAYGSVLASSGGGSVDLQLAYNNGNSINGVSGTPVILTAGDASVGGTILKVNGSISINGDDGASNIVGGLFGTLDKSFIIGKELNKPKESWTAESVIKTHGNSPGSGLHAKTSDMTTSTVAATAVTGSNISPAINTVTRIKATAVAREISNLGQASFTLEGAFKRLGSGAPIAMGSPTTTVVGFDGNGASYAFSFGISGNDVILVVYGDATAVYWAVTFEYQSISTPS